MKLATYYRWSLFFPVFLAAIILAIHPSSIIASTFIFGMTLYVPFMVLILLYWTYRKFTGEQMSRFLWKMPLLYALFFCLGMLVYAGLRDMYTNQVSAHFFNGFGLIAAVIAGFSVVYGYGFVILTQVLCTVLNLSDATLEQKHEPTGAQG